jgi:predicted RNase H-like nuclease (RuvC/YqgF family)
MSQQTTGCEFTRSAEMTGGLTARFETSVVSIVNSRVERSGVNKLHREVDSLKQEKQALRRELIELKQKLQQLKMDILIALDEPADGLKPPECFFKGL